MYDSTRLNSQILELQQNLTSEGNDNVARNVALKKLVSISRSRQKRKCYCCCCFIIIIIYKYHLYLSFPYIYSLFSILLKVNNETDDEYKFRLKKIVLSNNYCLMMFSYSNEKYNPPFLHDEKEFNREEFPIRMTDDRVLDRFVEWVLAAKFDQFTKLPLDRMAQVDHMHGLPGYIRQSQDG